MGNGEAEFVESNIVLADGGDRFGVSALTFDIHEELLWMGNEGVCIDRIVYTSDSSQLIPNFRAMLLHIMGLACKSTHLFKFI